MRILLFLAGFLLIALGFLASRGEQGPVLLQGGLTLGGGFIICALFTFRTKWHGIAGAVINNRFHLVSGMMQSAGALTFLDPTLSTHTAMHDILELQFGAPPPPTAATSAGPAPK